MEKINGKNTYFKHLDLLRFIAFFLVFWQHSFSYSLSSLAFNNISKTIIGKLSITGALGVQVFFVISGFLITFLLLKEESSNGKINIKHFYFRRIIRIWPLYYSVILCGIFILPNLFNTFKFNGDILKNLIFLNNFDMKNQDANIGIAWSVAIEEQFYLVWPLLFYFFKNKIKLITVSLVLLLSSFIFIIYYPSLAYFHTFGNIIYLMTGCIGAMVYTSNKSLIIKFINTNILRLSIILFFLVLILSSFNETINLLSILIFPIFFLYLILFLIEKESAIKSSILTKLGKYTYGMYLYHPIIIIFTKICFDLSQINYKQSSLNNFLLSSISLFITIFFSIISYNFFEKPFINLKYRYKFN